jgi:glycosyltransferase involved in cell wall biosynthesis
MTIAVNTRFLIKNKLEGFGWYTFEVLQILTKSHPEHQFIFFFDRPYSQEFIFSSNVTPIVLSPPARHPILFYAWFEWSVRRALKKYKVDVFLSTDNFLCLGTKVPTVLVVHDLAFLHFPEYVPLRNRLYYQYFMPKFLKRADKIITVSEYSKQDILKNFSLKNPDISISYNGCRTDFQPLNEDQKIAVRKAYAQGHPYFLYIGAIHPRKNVHRLIDAYNQYRLQNTNETDPPLLLLGGRMAWQNEQVRTAFENSTFKSDIIFLDYVPNEVLPNLTGAATALVYVSLFEGFGIPLLEAMRTQTPIITSNTSSMPEVVGGAGIVVNPYNIQEIAEAMQLITSNKEIRDALIDKGITQSQKFTWQNAANTVWKGITEITK